MELYENFSVEEKIPITEEKQVATQSNFKYFHFPKDHCMY